MTKPRNLGLCDCGEKAVKWKGREMVCLRCDKLEVKALVDYMRERASAKISHPDVQSSVQTGKTRQKLILTRCDPV
jgi:hypothetical protein